MKWISLLGKRANNALAIIIERIYSPIPDVEETGINKIIAEAGVAKASMYQHFRSKEDIAVAVRNNLAESMDDYGYAIIKTLITDIDPDSNVKDSMNRINAAKRDKEATMEEAEADKIRVVKAAEADAESKRLSGEGIAAQRLEIVRGFKESVEDFQKSLKSITHEEVMQFVLLTQYFDTLNNIGSNGKNSSILIPHSPGAMADFQQQIVNGTMIGGTMKDQIMANKAVKDTKKGKYPNYLFWDIFMLY